MVEGWLWDRFVLAVAVACVAALTLIVILALGYNEPRPGRPPDWEAVGLPTRMEVGPGDTSSALLNWRGGDFTVELVARPLAGQGSGVCGYGVVYRAQDADRFYVFAVASDGYYGVLRVEGEAAVPLVSWQQFPHVRRGRDVNRLLVTCTGLSCDLRINDEYATTVEDDRWVAGNVGLWVQSGEGSGIVRFDSVRVWRHRARTFSSSSVDTEAGE